MIFTVGSKLYFMLQKSSLKGKHRFVIPDEKNRVLFKPSVSMNGGSKFSGLKIPR